ncbi:uncharacterized protein DSM5745_09540 [Aspergillus mulundensis]|uniref:Major facilitator superfamily (MFS) profile domain-containing protein n=1 Tax=Aspergillus mulundensis TaxID=1810919 RepID=A0A3D8QVT0_9EURO|nr:hypothetical protein DSM5745_09540 [Aspergillus mulundensis]RDW65801.1 hypothetical protein DSM5745_09540 [Aspergillus mulundensis]
MLGMNRLEGAPLRAAIVVTGAFYFTLLGYDQGVLGGIIGQPQFLDTINNPNAIIQGLVVSIFDVGCMIGCAISGIYGLALGRRRAVILGCMLIVLGGAGQAAVYHIVQLVVFRIVTGIGLGIVSSNVPVWLAETSKARKRGQKVAVQLCLVLTGNVTAYWVNYGMGFTSGEVVFRIPIAWQCFYPLVAIVLALGLPQSPCVLYYWGEVNSGDEVLRRLYGGTEGADTALPGDTETSTALAAERTEILREIASEQQQQQQQRTPTATAGAKSLLLQSLGAQNRGRLLLIITLQSLQQLGGCNITAYYQTTLFSTSIGLPTNLSKLLAGFSAICFLLGTLPDVYLIERLGRRRLMLLGSCGCFTTMLLFTVLLALNTPSASWGAVAMLFSFQLYVPSHL